MKYSFQLAAVVLKKRGKNPRVMFVFRSIVPELGAKNDHYNGIEPLPDIRPTVDTVYEVLKDFGPHCKDVPRAGLTVQHTTTTFAQCTRTSTAIGRRLSSTAKRCRPRSRLPARVGPSPSGILLWKFASRCSVV